MNSLIIYGVPLSNFVWTVRLACAEKGVAYGLDPVSPLELRTNEAAARGYAELHPFKKVPAMRHGDFVLFESGAIARYIDATFPGPALLPNAAQARARVDQWISAICEYGADTMMRAIVMPRFVGPMLGHPIDEAAIAAAVPRVAEVTGVFDRALAERTFLAGDELTLADLFLLPMVFYLNATPEGAGLMPRHRALNRWFAAMAERPSFAATLPELPKAA